jgi:hypothetical protein
MGVPSCTVLLPAAVFPAFFPIIDYTPAARGAQDALAC